jgi:hypothetical protein
MKRETNGKWCIGSDEVSFSGQYDSREEAIEVGKDDNNGEQFFIGECEVLTFEKTDISLADRAYDQLSEALSEECGEAAEYFNPSDEQLSDLEDMLAETVLLWLKNHNLEHECYGVGETECIPCEYEDLDLAH